MVEDGNNYFTRKVFRKKKVVPGKVTPSFSEQQPPIPMISPPPYYTNNAVVRKKIIKPYVPEETSTLPPIEDSGALNRTEDDPRCKT